MTTSWSSPTTDEMGETLVAAHVEAEAPRVLEALSLERMGR
jgi:hypothetical protein